MPTYVSTQILFQSYSTLSLLTFLNTLQGTIMSKFTGKTSVVLNDACSLSQLLHLVYLLLIDFIVCLR